MVTSIFLVLAGLFSIVGSIADWDFFFESRRASALVNLFGRGGARVFYIVLGVVIAGVGVFTFFE